MEKFNIHGDYCGIPTLCISIASGIIIGQYIEKRRNPNKDFFENYKVVLGIALVGFITVPLFLGSFSQQYRNINNETVLDSSMAYFLEYFLFGTDTSKEALEPDKYNTSTGVQITNYEKNGSKIEVNYQNNEGRGFVEVPLLYYTVYTARDENGKILDIEPGNNNVIRVKLTEKKSGTITVKPEEHGMYLFVDLVSSVTFLALIGYGVRKKILVPLKNRKKCDKMTK